MAAILALSLTLKLTVWSLVLSTPTNFQDPDSGLYDASARSLLHLGAFTPSPELPEVAETRRTPGYPLFLAGVYMLFGENQSAAIVVQILVSLGTIALVYWLASRLWGTSPAVVAAFLLAVDVASFTSSLKLMSDTLFSFLLTAMLVAGASLLTSTRKALPALSVGTLLTMATFVRPVTYYLILPLALGVLALAVARRWRWRVSLIVLGWILVPYILGVGAWQVRNGWQTGSYQFSHFEGFNLLYYRGAGVVALRDDLSLGEARAELGLEKGHREFTLENEWTPEQDALWKRRAFGLVLDHPLHFLRSQLPGAIRLMLAPGEGGLLRMLGIPVGTPSGASGYLQRFRVPEAVLLSGWAVSYLAVLYTGVFSWAWAWLSARRVTPVDLFLWGALLYFVVISAGQGGSRFRVPVMSILALYSARGILHLGSTSRVWSRLRSNLVRTPAKAEGPPSAPGPPYS